MSHISQTLAYLRARFNADQEGATMVEYGLIVALIAIAVIGAVTALGGGIDGIFTEASDELTGTTTT